MRAPGMNGSRLLFQVLEGLDLVLPTCQDDDRNIDGSGCGGDVPRHAVERPGELRVMVRVEGVVDHLFTQSGRQGVLGKQVIDGGGDGVPTVKGVREGGCSVGVHRGTRRRGGDKCEGRESFWLS
jgi:hypothetical protein